MRKFTKAAAMLCAAAMVIPSASVFAAEDGGASELTEVGTYPISEEPLEFTMFRTNMPNVEDFQTNDFTKYMEDLTDMQNHVLPYLQSFCNLEEKGVKERREQQIAERYEGRADERVTSTEANEVVKDVGKTDRKPAQQKQAVDGKDKKLSIHERLEINKRIIQEKQGKDKTERGVDLGVRTV